MIKNIEVFPYNTDWPGIFEEEKLLLEKALGKKCIEIHHIGSTSVPGMIAKKDIDILCVVDNLDVAHALESMGYISKGEYNIPLRYYFSKNTPRSKINLHVVEKDHGFIELNLCFRDYLRKHEDAVLVYSALKIELVMDPKSHEKTESKFTGYNLGKNAFIKSILDKAGFNGLAINFCLHDKEWDAYHRIKEEQIFRPVNVVYNTNYYPLKDSNHYHFVLYRGTRIVAVAHIEFLNENEAALRSIAADEKCKNHGYGSYMLQFLERWVKVHGKNVLKLNSRLSAERFYRKFGYVDMDFHDPTIQEKVVDMGKIL